MLNTTKVKLAAILLSIVMLVTCKRDSSDKIPFEDIQSDLAFLDKFISQYSSYSGLNGFDYQSEFDRFLTENANQEVTRGELGIFLTRTIGKTGDRHAYVKGYDLPNTKFFPVSFAPYEGKVVVLDFDATDTTYHAFIPSFPFLKAISGISTEELLPQILPEDISAPREAYLTKAVRELRDIEKLFAQLGKELSNPIEITLSDQEGSKDTTLQISLVSKKEKRNKWDERFYREHFFLEEEDFNRPEVFRELFRIEDSIGYCRIPDMVGRDDAPRLFAHFNQFMQRADTQSKALIIDVRSNGGGVRDLIYEMAGFFVHPDSVYVVNAVRQRGQLPLSQDWKDDLHHRYLFALEELDERERRAVEAFRSSFEPMYELDNTTFSPFHYAVFNGRKLSAGKFHYNKPIYILANERSFSAASVLVAMYKDLPNIEIVGVTTDGSSGNSERFELPATELKGKISTMVSFQKDGKVLDGYGTPPDRKIERDLDQVFWKSDTQLEQLIEIIKTAPGEG